MKWLGLILIGLLILMTSRVCRYTAVRAPEGDARLARELAPVATGANLLFFPYGSVRKSLLRGDPSIAGVSFRPVKFHSVEFDRQSLKLFNGLALQVRVKERLPLVCFRIKGRILGMDSDGIVFFIRDHRDSKALRVIELHAPVRLVPGERVPLPLRKMVSGLLPVLDSVRDVRFSKIILNSEEWIFLTNKGIKILAGPSQGLLDRLKLLPPILHVLGKQKYRTAMVDLRSLDQPVLKVIPR